MLAGTRKLTRRWAQNACSYSKPARSSYDYGLVAGTARARHPGQGALAHARELPSRRHSSTSGTKDGKQDVLRERGRQHIEGVRVCAAGNTTASRLTCTGYRTR